MPRAKATQRIFSGALAGNLKIPLSIVEQYIESWCSVMQYTCIRGMQEYGSCEHEKRAATGNNIKNFIEVSMKIFLGEIKKFDLICMSR
jgi:hypothetical protein